MVLGAVCAKKLENFSVVPNLRVLMLGKNRLRTIENLDCLKKLDVLDLHRCSCATKWPRMCTRVNCSHLLVRTNAHYVHARPATTSR